MAKTVFAVVIRQYRGNRLEELTWQKFDTYEEAEQEIERLKGDKAPHASFGIRIEDDSYREVLERQYER